MTHLKLHAFVLSTLALLAAPRAAHASESYDNCTGFITSIPAVITTQGTWCLKQDLTTAVTSGIAITVFTNNVTIDCNDFKLGGLAAGAGTTATGIDGGGYSNLTVRHCNIRGFMRGLQVSTGGSGHLIEDNRFDNNTYVALAVNGDGSMVRRNRIFDTGQSTVNANPEAIDAHGSVDILDNTVSGVVARIGGGGSAYGIFTQANVSGRIIGNGVRGLVKDGSGQVWGIQNFISSRVTVRDNDLQSSSNTSSVGLYCTDSNSRSKDNTISGYATATTNCGDAGGNDILP